MLDPPSEHGPYWAHTRSAQHTTLIAEKQTARHSWSGQPFLRHCPASYSAEEPVVLHPLFFTAKQGVYSQLRSWAHGSKTDGRMMQETDEVSPQPLFHLLWTYSSIASALHPPPHISCPNLFPDRPYETLIRTRRGSTPVSKILTGPVRRVPGSFGKRA
jgi:hypothetical protein